MIHTEINSQESVLLQKKYPALATAIQWIKEKAESLPEGSYPLGDGIIGMVQGYKTRPLEESKFESHIENIDIQYSISGEEIMGWEDLSKLTVKTPYNSDKDVTLYDIPEKYQQLILSPKHMVLLFPEDGHMPKLMVNQPEEVRKVVVKIAMSLL